MYSVSPLCPLAHLPAFGTCWFDIVTFNVSVAVIIIMVPNLEVISTWTGISISISEKWESAPHWTVQQKVESVLGIQRPGIGGENSHLSTDVSSIRYIRYTGWSKETVNCNFSLMELKSAKNGPAQWFLSRKFSEVLIFWCPRWKKLPPSRV